MESFLNDFTKVIKNLFETQIKDPPAILQQILAQILRFGVLAICIACAILLVQTIIFLTKKETLIKAVATGVPAIVLGAIAIFAFSPISAAPKAKVESVASQTIVYMSAAELAQREAKNSQESDTQEVDATAEAEQVDTSLQRTIDKQTELSAKKAEKVVKLLNETKCTRTLMRALPEEAGQNILLRLVGGKKYNIALINGEAYAYTAEDSGFICKIKDYDAFYAQLKSIL